MFRPAHGTPAFTEHRQSKSFVFKTNPYGKQ